MEGSADDEVQHRTTGELVEVFHRMQVEHSRVVQHIAVSNDLNPADLRVLKYLGALPGASLPRTGTAACPEASTQKSVGTYLEMSPAAMTALTARLVRRGFLARESNPGDRRSVVLALKPEGVRVVGQLHAAYIDAIDASLTSDQRTQFYDACVALRQQLDLHVTKQIEERAKPSGS